VWGYSRNEFHGMQVVIYDTCDLSCGLKEEYLKSQGGQILCGAAPN
jgi:hypothetical protein